MASGTQSVAPSACTTLANPLPLPFPLTGNPTDPPTAGVLMEAVAPPAGLGSDPAASSQLASPKPGQRETAIALPEVVAGVVMTSNLPVTSTRPFQEKRPVGQSGSGVQQWARLGARSRVALVRLADGETTRQVGEQGSVVGWVDPVVLPTGVNRPRERQGADRCEQMADGSEGSHGLVTPCEGTCASQHTRSSSALARRGCASRRLVRGFSEFRAEDEVAC